MPQSYKITIKRGLADLAVVHGNRVHDERLSDDDSRLVLQTEAFLERLLGHRVHIDVDVPEEIGSREDEHLWGGPPDELKE